MDMEDPNSSYPPTCYNANTTVSSAVLLLLFAFGIHSSVQADGITLQGIEMRRGLMVDGTYPQETRLGLVQAILRRDKLRQRGRKLDVRHALRSIPICEDGIDPLGSAVEAPARVGFSLNPLEC